MEFFKRGADPEKVKKEAEDFKRRQERLTGRKIPTEAGAEEGDITDYLPVPMGAARSAAKGGAKASGVIVKEVINLLKKEGAPAARAASKAAMKEAAKEAGEKGLDYAKMKTKEEIAKAAKRKQMGESKPQDYSKMKKERYAKIEEEAPTLNYSEFNRLGK